MAESVAVAYGKPLFEIACEESLLDPILEDLKALATVFEQNPDFFRLLSAPVLPAAERIALARSIFSGKVEPYTLNFLSLLIEKSRIHDFSSIAREYKRAHHLYCGVQEVTVHSALPISQPLQDKLKAALEKITGKTIVLHIQTDPSLLGGISLETEGTVLDGSIRERLDALSKQLFATLG